MSRLIAPLVLLSLLAVSPAQAIVKGSKSADGRYAVRLVGDRVCSGVVIARSSIVTAAHCARGKDVIASGRTFRVAGISTTAVLDSNAERCVAHPRKEGRNLRSSACCGQFQGNPERVPHHVRSRDRERTHVTACRDVSVADTVAPFIE